MKLQDLSTRDLGRYMEQQLLSTLLMENFEVYMPVIDTGVDFVLRKDKNGKVKYSEIQVKSVREKGGRLTISKSTFSPRSGLFVAFFYIKESGDYNLYVIPSMHIPKICKDDVQDGEKIYRLNVTNTKLREIEKYRDRIGLIK